MICVRGRAQRLDQRFLFLLSGGGLRLIENLEAHARPRHQLPELPQVRLNHDQRADEASE